MKTSMTVHRRSTSKEQHMQPGSNWTRLRSNILQHRWLYFMVAPGIIYFLIFKYVPMYGIVIAFQNYQPYLGVFQSEWVGLKHFHTFFTDPSFLVLFRNTFVLALYNLIFFFPLPIVIALMLNEIKVEVFKLSVQTFIYIPHFMSWVVVVSIVHIFFTTDGIVNNLIIDSGGSARNFLLSEEWFRTMITGEVIWKETGWGTIIFLAALAGVDPQLYEAARMDGANRMRQKIMPCPEPGYVRESAPEYKSSGKVTYQEFLELVENSEQRYELIDGVIYNLASHSYRHQHAVGEIYGTMYIWFKGKSCTPLTSPFDITFTKEADNICVVQPDIIVICDKQNIDEKGKYQGVPALVVEVLSPSTRGKDIRIKLELYVQCGVQEYWIVDPMNEQITVYALRDHDIADFKTYTKSSGESLHSYYFDGLVVAMGDVFP